MKVLRKLLYCIILALFFPLTGYAEEIVPEKEQIEIIFVIDSSGSMKTNDRSGIGIDMVQAFIDTMQTQESVLDMWHTTMKYFHIQRQRQ